MRLRKRDVVLISQVTQFSREGFQRPVPALASDAAFDAPRRFRHFLVRQSVFLQGVISGVDFNRAQRHNLAFKHKADIFPLRRFFEPVAEPPASFRDC